MQLFFNLVPRKRLVKRLKEAARALIKTLLFKAALCRWEATTRDTFRSLRLPLVVGVASSRTLSTPAPPPRHPQPPFARLYGGRKKEHSTDAPQEVGWPLGWDLDPGIELEKHTFSPDQTSYLIPIFRWLLSLWTP